MLQKFKINQLDINSTLLRSDIVKAKNKFDAEQIPTTWVENVNGQVLPNPNSPMQNNTFYIVVIQIN